MFDYHHLPSLWECIIIGLITGFVNYTINTNQPKWYASGVNGIKLKFLFQIIIIFLYNYSMCGNKILQVLKWFEICKKLEVERVKLEEENKDDCFYYHKDLKL